MIALAEEAAEKLLREGKAPAQVITHYLKLGSSRERLEQEKLALETELVKAKTEQIAAQQKSEVMFAKAIEAMSLYQGRGRPITDNFEEGEYYEDGHDPDVF
jgi:hypothetical protein